jgi:hypothetical protein
MHWSLVLTAPLSLSLVSRRDDRSALLKVVAGVMRLT